MWEGNFPSMTTSFLPQRGQFVVARLLPLGSFDLYNGTDSVLQSLCSSCSLLIASTYSGSGLGGGSSLLSLESLGI